jgi:hypothetical protein
LHPKQDVDGKIREYLSNQVLQNTDPDKIDLSELLLVMHDSGMLDSEIDESTGEPVFSLREDIDEATEESAYIFYENLTQLDEMSYFSYIRGEKH